LEALRQLEVSYNEIRSMAALEALPSASLLELYAACNKITQIQVRLSARLAVNILTKFCTLCKGSGICTKPKGRAASAFLFFW